MAESPPAIEKFAPSSSGSSEGDILDLKDDEGWEDAEPEEEVDTFISLLDDEVFTDIMQMLNHCKEKHNFNFLELRQRLGLDFYGNIKLVNFIRSQVHSGNPVSSLTIEREDFEDEKFLKPVLEDDALLFNLDELPEVLESSSGTGKGKEVAVDSGHLVARVSELEEELRRIQSQFDDYRTTVKETLDERWNDKSTNGPSRSGTEKEEKRDDDSHYFSSYSYNGKFSLPDPVLIFL
jgi:type I protein arginine methyltransferase